MESPPRPFVDEENAPASALILAGAVAKAAFQAGALEIIAAAALPIARVCGTSAGALNAAVYAAGIHAGAPRSRRG